MCPRQLARDVQSWKALSDVSRQSGTSLSPARIDNLGNDEGGETLAQV